MFQWRDKLVETFDDVMECMRIIKTSDEAKEFLDLYSAVNPRAGSNIGYITGYFDCVRGEELRSLFGVEHPLLKFAPDDPEKRSIYAFKLGFKMAGFSANMSDADFFELHELVIKEMESEND